MTVTRLPRPGGSQPSRHEGVASFPPSLTSFIRPSLASAGGSCEGTGGQVRGDVPVFGMVAPPPSLISALLIGHRDDAVERLDSAVHSFGHVAPLWKVRNKRGFCAYDLDRNGASSIATEARIIKLMIRQFLTDKSVLGSGLYDKMGADRVHRIGRPSIVGGATSMAGGRRRVLVIEDDPETA